MKKCPNGHSVDDNAKFCPQCGAEIVGVVYCAKCGNELKEGSKFCPKCGNEMMDSQAHLKKEQLEKERLEAIFGNVEIGEEEEQEEGYSFWNLVLRSAIVTILWIGIFVYDVHQNKDMAIIIPLCCLINLFAILGAVVYYWRRDPQKVEMAIIWAYTSTVINTIFLFIMYWDGITILAKILCAGKY